MQKAQLGTPSSTAAALPGWAHAAQQADMPMPHRSRHPIRSAIRKLFGKSKLTPGSSDTAQPDLHEQVSHKQSCTTVTNNLSIQGVSLRVTAVACTAAVQLFVVNRRQSCCFHCGCACHPAACLPWLAVPMAVTGILCAALTQRLPFYLQACWMVGHYLVICSISSEPWWGNTKVIRLHEQMLNGMIASKEASSSGPRICTSVSHLHVCHDL